MKRKTNGETAKSDTVRWEAEGKKAKKQVIAVLLLGAVLLAADIAVTTMRDTVDIVEEGGSLYAVRPENGDGSGSVSMKVEIKGKNETLEKDVRIDIEPYGESDTGESDGNDSESVGVMSERERLEYGLRTVTNGIGEDNGEKRILLPANLETGEEISWEVKNEENSDVMIIVILTMMTAFMVYRNRFAAAKKREMKNRESVIKQLPEFVNRLVLLLNAGLVLTSAFEKATEEGIAFNRDKGDYFYGRLRGIYDSCKMSNASLYREFGVMAKESGVRELIRVSNIINDNVEKGVELTEKLLAESELLWMNRKNSCEEKGRLAETKLTLPLMIFLLVLIMITVSPAMLEL